MPLTPPMPDPKRVLILMSDTGGGHRAVAEAIREALVRKHGETVKVEVIDVFRHYTPFPFKYAPELYPFWIKRGKLMWRMSYRMTNQRRRARLVMGSIGTTIHRGLRRLLREHAADVVVSVHPLLNMPAIDVLNQEPDRPTFVTVITDLVSTHAFWYDRTADRILVPTQPAFDMGIKFGISPDKMRVTGLPINPRFNDGLISKAEARAKLGWDSSLPAVLLIGGGEGMGPLFRIAQRLNQLDASFQLAIVAGRNQVLKQRLGDQHWNHLAHIYPFVTNMPELMVAADLLVTKAGPTTICEACIVGLPMILSDAIPGQEDGNVLYITDHHAGLYAPGPRKVANAVKQWLAQGRDFLRSRAEDAHQLGHPDAVWAVADEVWDMAHHERIVPPARKPRFPRFRRKPSRGKSL